MIQTFKKIIVHIVLFSFALTYLPQEVFAGSRIVVNSGDYSTSVENSATWTLKTDVIGTDVTNKLVTHVIKGKNGTLATHWTQSNSGEYQAERNNIFGTKGTRGYYMLGLQDYTEQGKANVALHSDPLTQDIYVIIRSVSQSNASVPTPSALNVVEGIYYKLPGRPGVLVGSSDYGTLQSVSNTSELLYFRPIYDDSYIFANTQHTAVLKKYLQDTSLYLKDNKPGLTTGGLTQQYSKFCNSFFVKPDSSTNWELVKGLKDATNGFHAEVKAQMKTAGASDDNTSTEDIALQQAPLTDKDVDVGLYKKFYSDMDWNDTSNFFPNKIANTGDSIDVIFAAENASTHSWKPEDYLLKIPGTDITVADILKPLTGIDMAVVGLTTGVQGAKFASAQVGSWWAKAKVAKAVKGAANAEKLMATIGPGTAATEVEMTKILAAADAAAKATAAAGETAAASATRVAAVTKGASAALRFNVLLTGGTLAIVGAMKGVKWYVKKGNDEYYNRVFQLTLANIYAAKQMDFTNCIMENVANGKIPPEVAAAAGFTPEVVKAAAMVVLAMANETILQNANANDTNNLNQEVDTDACGKLGFVNIINWTFCEISQAIYYVVRAFVNWANSVALSVIGVTVSSR